MTSLRPLLPDFEFFVSARPRRRMHAKFEISSFIRSRDGEIPYKLKVLKVTPLRPLLP